MCATIILACFAIGSDLILPQLLKIALDSHITVSAQKLSFKNFSDLPVSFQVALMKTVGFGESGKHAYSKINGR